MADVFPARAGMSRELGAAVDPQEGFPRTRGDEPHDKVSEDALVRFSPHARG